MPNASNRTDKGSKKLGGSKTASNETPVSDASSTKGMGKKKPVTTPKPPVPKGDASEATGRDHPSQSEHAKALFEKLHGTSAKQNEHPAGGPPGGKGKKGGFGGGFSAHNAPKSGPPRRTQGKGG